ncbi:cofactor-independent phosphoglycerate mutase [Methanobrevibacter sp.]|uniref:cofactor-independent phosphoglycerate mutase n=1 Tax=Methanobrevibacter sp. TaxID=66852 RepID=UPI00388EC760
MKYVIFIPDGSSDYPVDELDGKTPLMVANTPNIDKLACGGFGGFTNNVPDGYTPGSDVANMSIFGFNPAEYYTGRGPLEAGSEGIPTTPCDVIFRCNTIFSENGKMDDFNAGHISTEEADELIKGLNEYFTEKYPDFKGKFYTGVSYRHLFIYSCDNVEDAEILSGIRTMPPHDIVGEKLVDNLCGDCELAQEIQQIMFESKEYLKDAEVNQKREIPANMVWLWGQGVTPKLPNFEETYGITASVITGVDLLRGIGNFAGMNIVRVPGATGYFDTDYKQKGEYGIESLKETDLLLIHIEAPDEAGHAQNTEEKVKAIERIDEFIVGPIIESLEGQDFRVAILPDHPTPISVGTHTRDDVPLVIYDSAREGDECKSFDEEGVKKGSLEFKEGYFLVQRLIDGDY